MRRPAFDSNFYTMAYAEPIFTSRGGGLKNIDQDINIDFGATTTKEVAKKELPTWISESTVRTAEVTTLVLGTY